MKWTSHVSDAVCIVSELQISLQHIEGSELGDEMSGVWEMKKQRFLEKAELGRKLAKRQTVLITLWLWYNIYHLETYATWTWSVLIETDGMKIYGKVESEKGRKIVRSR